jgi:Tol biopolymer transport system component
MTTSGYISDHGMLYSSPRNGRVAFHGDPQPQPSGDHIVDLVVANVDGTNATVLDADVSAMSVQFPVIAPTGDLVAVSMDKRQRATDIIVYEVSTRTKRTIATDLHTESPVFFSPDGRRIFYYSANDEIISIATDGSDRRVIVTDAYGAGDYSSWLDVAPDGRSMVYMRRVDTSTIPQIAICDLTTGASAPIGTGPQHFGVWPSFSPDGRSIVFVEAAEVVTAGAAATWLAIYDIAARSVRPLREPAAGEWPMFPQWSPKGDMVCASVMIGPEPDQGTASVRVYDVASPASTLIATNVALAYWVR